MEHFLLFYRIFFYTYGFSLLIFTIYKYVTTKNKIVGSFLFLWASMTATAALYVLVYYLSINFENIFYINFIAILQFLSIAFTSISLPMFVHKIFKIKRNYVIKIFIFSSSITLLFYLIPVLNKNLNILHNLFMITIITSNIYSFCIATKRILTIQNKDNKKLGIIFVSSFFPHFILLFIFDIGDILPYSGFLYFPIFYMWVGGFCAFLGLRMLKKTVRKLKSIPEGFIQKYKLTKREVEIAFLLTEGLTYKAIAEKLFISGNTVSSHVKHIYEKSNTNNKIQLTKEITKF